MTLDPRHLTSAHVLKGDRLAATLTRTSDGVRSAYTNEYLDHRGPAVASTLPVTDEPITTPSGALPPFFSNLLPEGRRLTALRRAVKTSADDELSLLIAVGDDPVGDVRVVPSGGVVQTPQTVPVTGDFSDVRFSDLLRSASLDPSALAGVQDKVSGRMITVPLAHQGRAHLVKLSSPEYPMVVENEHYFLTRATRMRHPVVTSRVVHDRDGVSGLLVERFDRVTAGDTVRRLAVEDGAQLLGIAPADKYRVSTEALMTRVSEVASSKPLALQALLRQLAFAWITGNGDLHAKNVSLVGDAGTFTVAPIYDIPSAVPYGDHSPALPVQGSTSGLSRKKMLRLADEVGLARRAAERALDDAVTASLGIEDEIRDGAIPFDTRRVRDLARNVTRRRETLTG